jgi:predicted DNA-binding protein
MRTVTLKLPESLAMRLRHVVARRATTQSAVIREALEAHLDASARGRQSCLDLARDLAGSVRGGPRDLSSNKRHLRGFGR